MSTGPQAQKPIDYGAAEDPIVYCTRLYVQFLQGLFNQVPPGTFKWEPDLETTEIVIRAEAPLDMSVVGKRPAITVVTGPSQYLGLSIDNMLHYDPKTGKKTRSDILANSFSVYCLADSDIIASKLAHIVSHFTRLKQRLLESPGGFYQIARPYPSTNYPSPPGGLVMGDPHGLVMVQVNIPFQFQWTWSTTPVQNPSNQTLEQITKHRRASEYEYASAEGVSKIKLAMSLDPVTVRKISSGVNPLNGLSYSERPSTISVSNTFEDFQVSGLEAFQSDTGE
jgi:hypothetical protein